VIATQAPERVLVDEWPDHGPELPRMADRHDCRRPDETLHELVEDRGQDDQARRRRAFLARVAEGAHRHAVHGFIQVRRFIDDGGVWHLNGHAAAPNLLAFLGGGLVDTGPGSLNFSGLTVNTQLQVLPKLSAPSNYTARILGRILSFTSTNDTRTWEFAHQPPICRYL